MRSRHLLLAAAFAGCFTDAGPMDEPTSSSTGTSETGTPTTGEPPGCGDGLLQSGEACDLGEANGQYAACNNACMLNMCGDGVLGPDELCDDGDVDEGDDCTTACRPPRCGDTIVHLDMGEMCDDGNADEDDDCTSRCRPPSCGDGILSTPEECDLGGNNADVGHCTTECKLKACGDGHVQPGEGCDGGPMPEAPCTAECKLETCDDAMLQMTEPCDPSAPMPDPECTPVCTLNVCGDGFVGPDEECDDGNLTDGDGCTVTCAVSTCGDGLLASDEQCDDGNLDGGDACGPTCTRDTYYVFVSSLRYAAGALGGLAAADMKCQMLAEAAMLPGKYRAWLSNGTVSPATRFSKSLDRAYVLPYSPQLAVAELVAEDWIDLVDGDLAHAIDVNEKGEVLDSGADCGVDTQIAWTATSRSAGPYDPSTHCMQWTTSFEAEHGVAGLIGGDDIAWTEGCPLVPCEAVAHLYCFEQP